VDFPVAGGEQTLGAGEVDPARASFDAAPVVGAGLLAVEVCNALKKESPNIFHDIEVYEETDGMPAVRVTHSKV
jgi:hypothetical protein